MDNLYVDKVIAGDIHAFRYFVKKYKDSSFNLAISIVKNHDHAEEVTQDAFVKAFQALKSFKKTASFKTWFYRILLNEAYQRLRIIKRSKLHVRIEDNLNIAYVSPINNEKEEALDIQIIVDNAINRLSERESIALKLFYLEEYSLAQTAKITGWSIANTKVILHRGRKNLYLKLKGSFINYK